MPLIETVTGPDLRTPDEVEEAILLVGRVCRSTGHVRVGMGASRQDVNVSVRGGTRVEIKGVPRASWAPKLVHGEAVRQVNLLRLRDELHQRGFKCRDDIRIEQAEVTYLFENSQLSYLRQQEWDKFVEQEGRRPGFELGQGPFGVRAIKLTGLAGVLSWPTQPDHIFAHELAGRIRVIAGLDQQPILLHSEKWPDYVDAQRELRKVKKRLGAGSHDAIIVVWGPQEDTLAAAEEVRLRLMEATEGIPPETRQPFADGSTDFERVLPGPDRMYPDTDSPPIGMTRERVERLKAGLPPPPWVREQQYRDKGIAKETIYYLIRRGGASLVDKVVQECQADLRQACYFFGERIKGLARKEQRVKDISIEQWCDFFKATALRPAIAEAWQQITLQVAESPHIPMRQVLENLGLINTSGNSGWQLTMLQILQNSRPTYDDGSWERRFRFYMGQIMKELRGKVPARDVVAALKEKLEPTLTNSLAGIEKHPSFIPDITA
jgi:glutamyl-tRNA(Gln) amidotransferase subunit E